MFGNKQKREASQNSHCFLIYLMYDSIMITHLRVIFRKMVFYTATHTHTQTGYAVLIFTHWWMDLEQNQ